MGKECTTGRVTIPTDVDVVPETLELVKRWGADAIRDCDGTDYPEELKKVDAKVYATYYTTRKDNVWAKANPDEIQQMYIMTSFHTATKGELSIHLIEIPGSSSNPSIIYADQKVFSPGSARRFPACSYRVHR